MGVKEGIIIDVLHPNLRKILHVGVVDGKACFVLDVESSILGKKVLLLLPAPFLRLSGIRSAVHLGPQLSIDAGYLGEDPVLLL